MHLLPSLFVLYNVAGLLSVFFSIPVFLTYVIIILAYSMIIFIHAAFINQSLAVGLLSIAASFVMLTGYGIGLISNLVSRLLFKSTRESEKPEITKE